MKIDCLSFLFFSPFPFLLSFLTSLLFLFSFAKMTTKFNQEFYARIKAKKNKPLSSIGQRRLRVVEKEKEKEVIEKGLSTLALNEGRIASPTLSVEEITPCTKKHKTSDKGKEKMGVGVWEDAETAWAEANEVVTLEELKEISGVPSHEMVNRHVHKLVQVTFLLFPSPFYFIFISTKYINCSLRNFGCQVLGEARPPSTWQVKRRP